MPEMPPPAIRCFDRIAQAEADGWDLLARRPGGALLQRGFLQAVENGVRLPGSFFYLQAWRAGMPLAIMAGMAVPHDRVAMLQGPAARLVAGLRRLWPGFLTSRTLEIGSQLTLGPGFATADDIAPEEMEALLQALGDAAAAHRAELILVRDFEGRPQPLEPALLAAGFTALADRPLTRLPLHWDNPQVYLEGLRKKVRYNLRRYREVLCETGIEVEVAAELPAPADQARMAELLDMVAGRAEAQIPARPAPQYHRAMAAALGPASRWILYREDGRLIAFLHGAVLGDTFHILYVGLDYGRSRQVFGWFNLFGDALALACALGLARIEAGAGSYGPKTGLGYSVLPLRMYARHRNRRVMRAFAAAPGRFAGYDPAPCRYVFRHRDWQTIWRRPREEPVPPPE